jgi:Zn-dependent protease with chaperone function
MAAAQDEATTTPPWLAWSDVEREHFLDAAARHRRTAWRITAACALAALLLCLVLSLLLAPLVHVVLGLALDLVNLAVPAPDLLSHVGGLIDAAVTSLEEGRPLPGGAWIELTLVIVLPGLVVMAVMALALARALRGSPLRDPGSIAARGPRAGDLAEQRFVNTVTEMAVAAQLPAPRVVFVEGGANAAAFGPDEGHAVVVVGSGLLAALDRRQMQGVAGHLVSAIADGDLHAGMRAALTLGLFTLPAALGSGWSDRTGFAGTARLLTALLVPTAANRERVLVAIGDPFRPEDTGATDATISSPARGRRSRSGDSLGWREWAAMPLMGPVFLAGFLGGLVATTLLGPTIALAWRRRKLYADAEAVRLTRDPDALGGALVALGAAGAGAPIAPWAAHLCVVDPGHGGSFMDGSGVRPFPSLRRRLQALVRQGADPALLANLDARPMPLAARLLLAVLGALVALLLGVAAVLLVWVSLAISWLFTLLPATLLHFLLRAVAG